MTKIFLSVEAYKKNELLNTRFVECKHCGETVVTASTEKNPFRFVVLNPELNKDTLEYSLHVCTRNCPDCE